MEERLRAAKRVNAEALLIFLEQGCFPLCQTRCSVTDCPAVFLR